MLHTMLGNMMRRASHHLLCHNIPSLKSQRPRHDIIPTGFCKPVQRTFVHLDVNSFAIYGAHRTIISSKLNPTWQTPLLSRSPIFFPLRCVPSCYLPSRLGPTFFTLPEMSAPPGNRNAARLLRAVPRHRFVGLEGPLREAAAALEEGYASRDVLCEGA